MKMVNNEFWRKVKGFEGIYEVSNLGRVKSLSRKANDPKNRNIKERILKQFLDNKGYFMVGLYKDGKKSTKKVHVIVAESFLNHKPDGTLTKVVDHINNIKSDNSVDNLQIISNRENSSKDRSGYSSKYVGVSWNRKRNKWEAYITINGKKKNLGLFDNEKEAHKEYLKELKLV